MRKQRIIRLKSGHHSAGHEAGKPVAALREEIRAESHKRIALGFDRETIETAPLRRRSTS
jgi:hypothetical protein